MILGGMDEEDPEGRKAFFQLSALFEMQFGGSYKLDNGDGLEDTSDDMHRWEVRTWPKAAPGEVECATHAAVAAVGTNSPPSVLSSTLLSLTSTWLPSGASGLSMT